MMVAREREERAQDRLLTPDELAAELQIPVATLYRWRSLGTGPAAFRLGRHLRYRRQEVERWLAGRSSASGGSL